VSGAIIGGLCPAITGRRLSRGLAHSGRGFPQLLILDAFRLRQAGQGQVNDRRAIQRELGAQRVQPLERKRLHPDADGDTISAAYPLRVMRPVLLTDHLRVTTSAQARSLYYWCTALHARTRRAMGASQHCRRCGGSLYLDYCERYGPDQVCLACGEQRLAMQGPIITRRPFEPKSQASADEPEILDVTDYQVLPDETLECIGVRARKTLGNLVAGISLRTLHPRSSMPPAARPSSPNQLLSPTNTPSLH